MDYSGHPQPYYLSGQDMSAANKTLSVRGPKGKRGLLMDYGFFNVTTAFAGATNPPEAEVGDGVTANKYGDVFNPGNLGLGGGATLGSVYAPTHATWKAAMKLRELAADTDVVLTGIAAAGAGNAGIAGLYMLIVWER